ncbi:hypothetical protein VNO77_46322 [Canavalia gladiata]|uniref:Uncharacterized protein n=1 Tax=Canavalia gladiata TaxID=3824 RepID=A0AAN9PI19_CANGL
MVGVHAVRQPFPVTFLGVGSIRDEAIEYGPFALTLTFFGLPCEPVFKTLYSSGKFSESRKVVSKWLWGSQGIRITDWNGIEGDHGELCKADKPVLSIVPVGRKSSLSLREFGKANGSKHSFEAKEAKQ